MGPAAAFNINDDFSLNLEILFSLKSYSSIISLFSGDTLRYNEKQAWIDIPLYVRYEKTYGKWSPYIYGGYSFNFLLSAKATATFVNIEPSGKKSTEVNDKSIYDQRQKFNTSWLAGVGTRYRIGYKYISLEVRYMAGLTNQLNSSNQYPFQVNDEINANVYSTDLQYSVPRVDSYFRMNSISIMIGYVHPLYKPRKIENKPQLLKALFTKKND